MRMGIWIRVVTYNCNFSGSNQDIIKNEAPFYSWRFSLLNHYIFVPHFFIIVIFKEQTKYFFENGAFLPIIAIFTIANTVLIIIKNKNWLTTLTYILYKTIIFIPIALYYLKKDINTFTWLFKMHRNMIRVKRIF